MPNSKINPTHVYDANKWVISIVNSIRIPEQTAIYIEGIDDKKRQFVNQYRVQGNLKEDEKEEKDEKKLSQTSCINRITCLEHTEIKFHKQETDFIGSVPISPSEAKIIITSIKKDEEKLKAVKQLEYKPLEKTHPFIKLFGYPQLGDGYGGWCWEKLQTAGMNPEAFVPVQQAQPAMRQLIEEGAIFFHGLGRAMVLLPIQLIGGFIVLPVAMVVIKKEQPKLPWFLRWFDNADQYVGRDITTFLEVCKKGNWERYKWLAWRNPLNYLGYKLGIIWTGDERYIGYNEKTAPVGNTSGCIPGYQKINIIRVNKKTNKVEKFHSRRLIYAYVNFFHKPDGNPEEAYKCVEYYTGHKIGEPYSNQPGGLVQIVNRASPGKSYRGLFPADKKKSESQSSSSSSKSRCIIL